MDKDGTEEKLRRAKANLRQSQVLFCISIVIVIFTMILLRLKHLETKTGIAIFGIFWPLGIAGFIGFMYYGRIVGKYKKPLEESPKKKNPKMKNEERRRALKSLDSRLANGEITKKEYEERKKALEQ